jgi:hypothetical protein
VLPIQAFDPGKPSRRDSANVRSVCSWWIALADSVSPVTGPMAQLWNPHRLIVLAGDGDGRCRVRGQQIRAHENGAAIRPDYRTRADR